VFNYKLILEKYKVAVRISPSNAYENCTPFTLHTELLSTLLPCKPATMSSGPMMLSAGGWLHELLHMHANADSLSLTVHAGGDELVRPAWCCQW
jgi:hypothetical protein